MTPLEMVLNIAVNLGRIGRFSQLGNGSRANYFLKETKNYVELLELSRPSERFKKTFSRFKKEFEGWLKKDTFDDADVENIYTWANILTHRAKLA